MDHIALPEPTQKARTRNWHARIARSTITPWLLVALMISAHPTALIAQGSTSVAASVASASVAGEEVATPVRLIIPSINVDTVIESVGKTADGQIGVPQDSDNTAWYNLGISPGARGNAVISGHLDDKVGPAVFWRLRELKVDDTLTVVDAGGVERTFAVIEVASYPYNEAPLTRIFGFDLESDLNLITCAGRFNRRGSNYSQRLVVYTRLVP